MRNDNNIRIAVFSVVVLCVSVCQAGTFTYEIEAEIRYDVVDNGVTYPDTPVWGMPAGTGYPSGTLILQIDAAGNVSGSTPVHPVYGLGMLYGKRLYALYNPYFQLYGGAWGTPVNKIAPLTSAIVDLRDTFIGDFDGLNSITGFLEDGNSGDYFHLGNGVGADGKLEFTVTGPDGMSMTFRSKNYGGVGTGWYVFGIDSGDITYSNGTDAASVNLTGVIPFDVYIDASARTFYIPLQVLLNNFPTDWWVLGRRIDTFSGTIDPTGNFVGTAHFAGIDYTSLTTTTTNGTFEDGNSPGFNADNGLRPGDTFNVVMTDSTGLFDLVIGGTLLATPGDCDADGDVDLVDHDCFVNCLTGPGGGLLSNCDPVDFDTDDDVDLGDFAAFAGTFTGP